MNKEAVLICSTILGASAVIFGAFGAHLLKKYLTPERLDSFETGVRYQMYHALFLFIAGVSFDFTNPWAIRSAWCMIIGTLLFSFSIYLLIITSITSKKWKWLGPVTPLGGLLMIAGWIFALLAFL